MHRSRLIPAVALAAGLLAPSHALGATFTVTTTADGSNGTCTPALCTLRDAITEPTLTTGDEIVLPAGTYSVNLGQLFLDNPVAIRGAGAGQTIIDAGGTDRVFNIEAGPVQISNVKVTGGQGSSPSSLSVGDEGGGIYNAATLVLSNVLVTGNKSGNAGPAGAGQGGQPGGGGGGVFNWDTGNLTIENSTISSNQTGDGSAGGAMIGGTAGHGGSGGDGGGVSSRGNIEITNTTISGNITGAGAPGGAGGAGGTPGNGGSGGNGGGLYVYSVFGTAQATLDGVTVSGNTTGAGAVGATESDNNEPGGQGGSGGQGGGAVVIAPFTMTNATVTGNATGNGAAGGEGGTGGSPGISGDGGRSGGLQANSPGTISRTEISGNSTGDGGTQGQPGGLGGKGGDGAGFGTYYVGTGIFLRDSTVANNTAGDGGSPNGEGGDGGGVYAEASELSIENSTLAGNSTGAAGLGAAAPPPGGSGGGLFHTSTSTLDLTHLTIAGNQIATGGVGGGIDESGGVGLTLANSIVTGNGSADCSGTITDSGNNVRDDDACPGTTGDPLLQALAENGGPTPTMALGEGSAAIDVVPTSGAGCLPADQRGITRPQRTACDAGAFEAEPPPPPDDTGGGTTTPPADGTTPPTINAPTTTADTTRPTVSFALRVQRLLRALRRGYAVGFRTSEPGRAVAELFAEGRDARRAATRKRVARGVLSFTTAGKKRVVAKFTKRARRAFGKRKKLRLLLRLTVVDAAGNRTVVRRRITLKR